MSRGGPWISAKFLVVLCGDVIVANIIGLVKRAGPDPSRLGVAVSAAVAMDWWGTDDVLSLGLLFRLGDEAKEAFEAAPGEEHES